MSVADLSERGNLSSMKSERGDDDIVALLRHLGGVSNPYAMTRGGPGPWVLQGLEGPGLNTPQIIGFPLMRQPKMQKCEKCSQEFWSPVNYRRHVLRVHRQSLNENDKNRDLLAAFWDTLSLEQTTELMSFDGVKLKDIPGLNIIAALTSSLRPPVLWNLPSVCVDAGSALMDIFKAKPSRLQIKSHDLFSILDDALEGTFLCAGTAESVQNYVFVGNTAKNSLEFNNVVASAGFLIEQQLVKAWYADKDVEALRCQKLLVEEEEAAQRRHAANLEKKRQKKLRKEQKMKEIYGDGDKQALDVVDSVDSPTLPEAFDLSSPSDISSSSPDAPENNDSTLQSLQFESDNIESQLDLSSQHILEKSETIGLQAVSRNGPGQLTSNNWQVRKSRIAARPRLNVGQNRQTFKPNLTRNQIQQNRGRVWTKKYKDDSDKNGSKPPASKEETTPHIAPASKEETTPHIAEDKCDDVKLPAFKEETTPQIEEDKCEDAKPPAFKEETTPQIVEDKCVDVKPPAFKEGTTPQIEEDKCDDVKPPAFKEQTTLQTEEDDCDDVIIGSIPITLKSRREEVIIGSIPVKLKSSVSSYARANLTETTVGRVNGHDDRAISGEKSKSTNSNCVYQGEPLVSSNEAANSGEHVKLGISSPELPPSNCVQNHKAASQVPDIPKRSVLGNAEINQVGVGVQAKSRKKAKKASKTKNTPQQKE